MSAGAADVVVIGAGHNSLITAAYLAGVFSLTDAAVLVSARARLMQACTPGAMIAIHTSEHHLADLLDD